MKKKHVNLLCFLFLFSSQSFSLEISEIFPDEKTDDYQSDQVFIDLDSEAPFELLPDFEGGDPRVVSPTQDKNEIKHRPIVITGHRNLQRGFDCEPFKYESKLKDAFQFKMNPSETEVMNLYTDTTQSFIQECEKKLTVDRYANALIPMIDSRRVFYPLLKNKKILPIRIRLGGPHKSTEIRALLGVQDLHTKRPLVILRNGLQSNRNSEMAAVYIMKLMDEGGFNVIALPSNTGRDFQETNMEFALGGIDEALQTIRVAKEIQNPDQWTSKIISSVHVIGYSLGGQTALYTALFNGYQPKLENGKAIIDSALAVCPVVDLKKSINHLYKRNNIIGVFFFFNMIRQMKDLLLKFPTLELIGFDPEARLSMRKLKKTISQTVYPHYQKKFQNPGWLLPPLEDLTLKNEDDYWKAHDFNQWIDQLKTPVLTIGSRDDGVVRSKDNAAELMKNYEKYAFSQGVKKEDYLIRFLDLKSGSHCQLHSGYGWGVASSFIKSWIAYHSPEYLSRQKKIEIQIPDSIVPPLEFQKGNIRQYKGSQWEAIENQNFIRLHFYFSEYIRSNKKRKNYSLTYKVPYSLFQFLEEKIPKTALDAQIFTRWLNANVRIWGEKSGLPFEGGDRQRPKIIEITELDSF